MEDILGLRFFDILMEEARAVGEIASSWKRMKPTWRIAFAKTLDRFLDNFGWGAVIDDEMEDEEYDEQIRILCERLPDGVRLKLYHHLHALGCRI